VRRFEEKYIDFYENVHCLFSFDYVDENQLWMMRESIMGLQENA